jgi:hypothetical protein
MREQWNELKETIIELRDNNGTATQQEVCQFLVNLMNVLEAQIEQERKKGKWVHLGGDEWCCSFCGHVIFTEGSWEHPLERGDLYCERCGAEMGDNDAEIH